MADTETKKFTLRDLGVVVAIAGVFGNLLYTAASNSASANSTADWHETRITKLETWQADVTIQLHQIDRKIDRLLERADAGQP